MVCFEPSVCLSIRKSCQRRDCSELGTVRNWVDHCNTKNISSNVLENISNFTSVYCSQDAEIEKGPIFRV